MAHCETDPAIGRQVRGEHRRVESLLAELLDALAEGARPAAIAGSFACLRAALEVHLAREERLYFPAVAALRPDLRCALAGFAAEHGELRVQLEAASAGLGGADPALTERVTALAARFAGHESVEEALLRALERDRDGHAIASH